MRQLLIATRNKGKIKEIEAIMSGMPFELISLDDLAINGEVSENGKTFEENAVIKAKIIGEKTKMLTLAEDSGLEVDALGKRPGVLSARYCKGSDLDRIHKLLKELNGIPKEKRTARFKTVIAVYDPSKNKISTFEGVSKGFITEKRAGENGFGYDPVFFNFDLGKTNAQASLDEKNRVSHRARALRKAKEVLRTSGG